jgi:hypothetical protein
MKGVVDGNRVGSMVVNGISEKLKPGTVATAIIASGMMP